MYSRYSLFTNALKTRDMQTVSTRPLLGGGGGGEGPGDETRIKPCNVIVECQTALKMIITTGCFGEGGS